MARQTTNYGLTKPDYTDIADIEVVNANMDIIDGALKVIDTKSNNVMSKNSSAWSSTVAYAVGQYCIYNNSLWKCLVQHSGQTPQEGTYWARVSLDTLGSEINALNNNLIVPDYKSAVTIQNNYICTSNGYVIGTIQGEATGWASIRSSNQMSYFLAIGTSSDNPIAVCIPFAAGDTVVFGEKGTYNLAFVPTK